MAGVVCAYCDSPTCAAPRRPTLTEVRREMFALVGPIGLIAARGALSPDALQAAHAVVEHWERLDCEGGKP